jgi:hypothetical protein
MSTRGAGDCEENKIFKDIATEGMRSGKGDDDRTKDKKTFGNELERIFGKKKFGTARRTKIIYNTDGTKTEIVKEY